MEESRSTKTMYILLMRYHIFYNFPSVQLISILLLSFLYLYTQSDDGLLGPQYVHVAYCYIINVVMFDCDLLISCTLIIYLTDIQSCTF
jgi:hypothetical protein